MKSHQQINIEGQLYWRSDTRNPLQKEKLFENGSKAREPINDEEWWRKCIRVYEDGSSDADPLNCISLSTNFFSAGIFPFLDGNTQEGVNESYIYAIALPPALKINCDLKIISDFVPKNKKSPVIDLHSFQAQYAKKFLEENKNNNQPINTLDELEAVSMLYSYEAMAHHLNTQNIICAVKVIRYPQQIHYISDTTRLPSCHFEIASEILMNPHSVSKQKMIVLNKDNQPISMYIDYSKAKKKALTFLRSMKGILHTPTPIYGLGGKVFKSPDCEIPSNTNPAVNEVSEEFSEMKEQIKNETDSNTYNHSSEHTLSNEVLPTPDKTCKKRKYTNQSTIFSKNISFNDEKFINDTQEKSTKIFQSKPKQ